MIWIGVAVAALVLLAVGFNRLAKIRNIVESAWSDIDVQLKRRSDLVPNLVETTKGYSGFERDVLESVTKARSEAATDTLSVSQRSGAESELGGRIHNILIIAEQYPELKATAQFLKLQEELSETEDNIANARRYYNAATRDMNTLIESFPLSIVAAVFRFRRGEYFELDSPDEAEVPSAKL